MKKPFIHKILVIGAGGTGSALFIPLCRYLSSQAYDGRVVIADGDKYEISNADRQNFSQDFIGDNKAQYQVMVAESVIPSDNITYDLIYVDRFLTKEDINNLVEEHTIVVNCVDNKAARKYVEDRVLELNNAYHICCGNEKTSGQTTITARVNGKLITKSLYDLYPKFNSVDGDRSVMSCEEMAQLPSGGQIIMANMTAAVLALNFIQQIFTDNISCSAVEFMTNWNSFKQIHPIEKVLVR